MKIAPNANISPMMEQGGYQGYTGYEDPRKAEKEAMAQAMGLPTSAGAGPNYGKLDRDSAYYQGMLQTGMDYSPTNLTGGLARLANAFVGRQGLNRVEKRENEYAEQEAATAQAQKDKFAEMARMMAGPDADPQTLAMAQFDPEGFMSASMEAQAEANKPYTLGKDEVRYGHDGTEIARGVGAAPDYQKATIKDTNNPSRFVEVQYDPADPQGTLQIIGEAEPTSALVSIQNGETQKKLEDYEPETIIDWSLTGQDKQPEGYVAVRDPNARYGYRIEPFANSEAAAALVDNETRLNNSTAVTRSLINSYGTLANNKAIPTLSGSRGDQIAGAFGSTFVGKGIDASGFGNMENDAARGQIDGISMNSLMQMISMSDVSARAMDSDAEMRAWLGAIKGDVYEEALVKLHVLDMSFGSGTALDLALESGEIGQDEYDYVMKQMGTGAVQSKLSKAQQYASLEGEGKLYDGRDLSEERGKPLLAAPTHSGSAKRKRFNPATGRVE